MKVVYKRPTPSWPKRERFRMMRSGCILKSFDLILGRQRRNLVDGTVLESMWMQNLPHSLVSNLFSCHRFIISRNFWDIFPSFGFPDQEIQVGTSLFRREDVFPWHGCVPLLASSR